MRRRHRLAVIGSHDDHERLVAQAELVERLHQLADGLVVLGHLREVASGHRVLRTDGGPGDPVEEALRRVERLVGRVVVAEDEEALVLVLTEPVDGVRRDLARVERAVAVVGDALEAEVHAHRRVADHEVVIDEAHGLDAPSPEQQRQHRGVGLVEPVHLIVGELPVERVEAELGRARAAQHRDGPGPGPRRGGVGMREADAAGGDRVERGRQARHAGEEGLEGVDSARRAWPRRPRRPGSSARRRRASRPRRSTARCRARASAPSRAGAGRPRSASAHRVGSDPGGADPWPSRRA